MSAAKLVLFISLLAVAGCASTSAPPGWLPNAEDVQQNVYGGWITAEIDSSNITKKVSGELLAVEQDSVYILTYSGLRPMYRNDIARAKVAFFEGDYGGMRAWTLVGTLSTLSHGFYLLISAPLWILAGTVAVSAATHDQLIEYPRHSWNEMKKYSRFPQGFPAAIDRSRLLLR
ncbi:MAG TPA: hypothetical protein VL633_10385 [Bacteroidota bacterium]|jgi:hypothetical protein|nr:hypothetical protein [Bacteroidota bacterium]